MRQQTIAIFASAFHPHLGGVEEVVRQVGKEYLRRGIGVIVITNRWPRSLPVFGELDGIPIYRIALRTPERSLKAKVSYALTHKLIRRRVIGIVRKHHCNLLHVHCVSSNGYYALIAKNALRLPLVVTAHGERTMDSNQIYQHSSFLNGVLRKLMIAADFVTACSRRTLEDLENYLGRPFGARGSVVYSGVAPDDFAGAIPYDTPRPYILAMGRLVREKGFDLLIQAFAKTDMDVELLIAGEGPERLSLEHQIRDLGLEGRVTLFGRADRTQAVALFAGCRFFVMSSRQEPMGIVNLEAMAAGKAVIAPRVDGVPEIVVDGETGLLVPSGEIDGYAKAMMRLNSDPELRRRLGEAGKLRVQNFGWPKITDQYLEIYSRIMAKNCGYEGSVAASVG